MDSSFILFLLLAIGARNAASVSVDSETEFVTFIVGGLTAPENSIPYQVALLMNGMPWCGGSIIDENHVLTAAHCLAMMPPNGVVAVRAGSTHSLKRGSEHEVIQSTIHEKYRRKRGRGLANDIAILKVFPSFKFDESRALIKLYGDSEKDVSIYEKEVVKVSGFGATSIHGTYDPKLRFSFLVIANSKNCSDAYEDIGYIPILNDRFCAGNENSETGTCSGDSGGPVVLGKRQIGITSYVSSCADPDHPGVYTNVAYFAKWIEEHIS